jgi:hypothetical protein
LRLAFLRGREHLEIGAVAVAAEGPAAVALSRGGAGKPYPHRDPNEDAALFASGPGGVLLAAADAHDGALAAEIALDSLLAHPAEQWTAPDPVRPESWPRQVLAALLDANAAIRREVVASETPRSCTTLALALLRPQQGWLYFAAVGDSHVFRMRPGEVVDRGPRSSPGARRRLGSFFLGYGDEDAGSLGEKCTIGAEPLGPTAAVVVATDGVSERRIGLADPCAALLECGAEAEREEMARRPLALARRFVERALAAHAANGAGDNVAVAAALSG